jgi:hypothetical protein
MGYHAKSIWDKKRLTKKEKEYKANDEKRIKTLLIKASEESARQRRLDDKYKKERIFRGEKYRYVDAAMNNAAARSVRDRLRKDDNTKAEIVPQSKGNFKWRIFEGDKKKHRYPIRRKR